MCICEPAEGGVGCGVSHVFVVGKGVVGMIRRVESRIETGRR